MDIPARLEATLRIIGSLRLDDMPKTGGKLALCRLQYAVCAARDVLSRNGLNDIGPLEKAARHDVAMEMNRDGNKLETEWQHERIRRARGKDRAERREPDEALAALEARVVEYSDRISALLSEKADLTYELRCERGELGRLRERADLLALAVEENLGGDHDDIKTACHFYRTGVDLPVDGFEWPTDSCSRADLPSLAKLP